jgi:Skp family chaperone for outer membrane proteins
MRWIGSRQARVLGLGILALCVSSAAKAQIPYEPAEINACVCLQQASGALLSEKDAKGQALGAVNRELADLDAQLAAERPRVDVNSPDSVSRYKALLERRDAAYRQLSPAQSDAAQAVARYNASVDEYNHRCAGRPFNAELEAQIQAHPNCPPPR